MSANGSLRAAACLLLPVLLLLSGCGESGPSGPGAPDAATLTQQGWDRFEVGDWAGARSRFLEAVQKDGTYADAHNGRGWASLELATFTEARAAFDAASNLSPAAVDPLVGLALMYRDVDPGDPARVVDLVTEALSRAPQYRFVHDRSLDWRDLRLLLAQAHFTLGSYTEANDQVGLLGGQVADPQSGSFVRDLLAEIERLGKLLNG